MRPLTISISVRELAEKVHGTPRGACDLVVSGLRPISQPAPNTLTFLRSKSERAIQSTIRDLPAMAVLVDEKLVTSNLDCGQSCVIAVKDAQRAFLEVIPVFFEQYQDTPGIHPSAVIDSSARLGKGVIIGPTCYVGAGCSIGDNSVLHNNVTLYPDVTVGARARLHSGVIIRDHCSIGDDAIIHNNVVIGADGFGYLSDPAIGIRKVPHIGSVTIGSHVEIGANTTIDRGSVGTTSIGSHTKIDNQVQVGHNVQIGSYCLLCGQVGIAGSAIIEDRVTLSGGAGVADHIRVASGARIGARGAATSNIEEPGDYLGMPAVKATEHRRLQVILRRLVSKPRSKH